MTGIWATLKAAAPSLTLTQQSQPQPQSSQHQKQLHDHEAGSSTHPSSPPKTVNSPPPASRSLPRPPSSLDARGTRSQASTTSQPHSRSPGRKSPARLSRHGTAATLKEKGRAKDREGDVGQAADTDATTAAATDATNGGNDTSEARIARPAGPSPVHTPGSSSAIDPLSQQIFLRKTTETSIPQRLTQMAGDLARASTELSRNVVPMSDVVPKDKRKGSSFLSRLGVRGGRKKEIGDLDSDSELGSEARMDGINARVFGQTLGSPLVGGGYVPHHKEPPRYIRTRASNKRTREFNRMFLAQELVGTRPPEGDADAVPDPTKAPVVSVSVAGSGDRKTTRTGGAIWATEFSKDGRYLATGGRDNVVRVWAVLSTPEERRTHEDDENPNGGAAERLSAPVFRDQPVKEFKGHTGEVLDLSWSKNNFLLSSSMDKTVRLWHLSRSECLCAFKHKDFVTRLAFHPRDDRFFLAGSLDTMLRLWSIPDRAVAFSAQLPDLVTAVAFSPDGKVAIAGLLNGLCMFYETEGLKPSAQIHVRSSRGKNAKGSKITGIQTMLIPPPSSADMPASHVPSSAASLASTDAVGAGEVRVLITSNDSRIRIYSLRDKSLDVKLKGHDNLSSQIAATFSDDGKYVICGSEDRKAFIWSMTGSDALVQDKDKCPCEYFEAHGDMVTTALFAPTKTRMLLGLSGDPIYDLCNPPPVVLQSLEEAASAAASQVALTNDSHTPGPIESVVCKRPEPSRAYIARSTHYDGNIIVTTGDTGIIKVFRQDCAFAKRRLDSWETGSTFSRKLAAHGGLGRSASVITRTSAGSASHSRRGSLSQVFAPGGPIGTPQQQLGAAVGTHSERILSWRQGIEHGGDRRSGISLANGGGGGGGTPARSERSLSPTKASGASLHSAYNLAGEARKQPYAGASPARYPASSILTSPTASVFSSPAERPTSRAAAAAAKDKERAAARESRNSAKQEEPSIPPTPGFTLRSAKDDGGGAGRPSLDSTAGGGSSSSFWNLGRWRGITGFRASSAGQALTTTGGGRARSNGSRPSLSRSRHHTDNGSCDEREADDRTAERARTSRRQSAGVASVVQAAGSDSTVGGRPKSLPMQGGSDRGAASTLTDKNVVAEVAAGNGTASAE